MSNLIEKDLSCQNGNSPTEPNCCADQQLELSEDLIHSQISNTLLIPGEADDRFKKMSKNFELDVEPDSEFEEFLVHTMAVNRWRQMRSWSLEKIILNGEILAQERDAPKDDPPRDIASKTGYAFQFLTDRSSVLSHVHRNETEFTKRISNSMRQLIHFRDSSAKKWPNRQRTQDKAKSR